MKMELGNRKETGKTSDVYLTDAFQRKYRRKKNLTTKLELQEKITDFEQKGLSWLEPAREFVLSLNRKHNLLKSEKQTEMTTFLKNIGSNTFTKPPTAF